MTYDEVLAKARQVMAPKCRVCPECNGIACRGEVPGVGAVGSGAGFIECRTFLKSLKIHMDAIHEEYPVDTAISLFGKTFSAPFFVAPIGGMPFNYTGAMTEEEYSRATVFGALDEGIFAFTGDGPLDEYFPSTLPVIREAGGVAVSTIKPWAKDKVFSRIHDLEQVGCMAFAMDVDSAALVNLKLMGKPAYPQPLECLREFAASTSMPFIVKGIMTPASAEKCAKAGAWGIVVSTHGGRVSQDFAAPCSMLRSIRAAVGRQLTILVDGGIRSGGDVFKCLALGADAVLIGRPYAIAAHGGGREGVRLYTQKIAAELRIAMLMSDSRTLADITPDKIMVPSAGPTIM